MFKNLATTLPGVKDKDGEKSTHSLGGDRVKIAEQFERFSRVQLQTTDKRISDTKDNKND